VRRVCARLALYCGDYRWEKDVLPLVDEILRPVNSGDALRPITSSLIARIRRPRWRNWNAARARNGQRPNIVPLLSS
jgi:hypothetical protein